MERIYHKVEQNTDEWFKLRMGRITASEFNVLMGSKDTTQYRKLVAQKAFERMFAKREETYSNEWMQRGHDLEDDAALAYMRQTMQPIKKGGFVEFGNAGCSPDGLIDDDGLIEIKCPALHTHIEYLKGDQVPAVYRWQVQGQLYVTGRKYCDFVSYFPDVRLFITRVEPDTYDFVSIASRLEQIELDIINTINLLL